MCRQDRKVMEIRLSEKEMEELNQAFPAVAAACAYDYFAFSEEYIATLKIIAPPISSRMLGISPRNRSA